jgi:DNA polymerase III beta subunit
MKANSLVSSLALLDKVIPGKPLDPIMGNLEFSPTPAGLTIRAVSPNIDLSLYLGPVEGLSVGIHKPFLLPNTVFTKLARSLGDAEATLAFEGEDLSIVAGSFSTRLRTIRAELPQKPVNKAEGILMPASNLAMAVQRVAHAAATEDYRGVFTGIELSRSSDFLTAVATDGFRLAVQNVSLPRPTDFKVLIPANSVPVLLKFLALAGPDETATLYPDRNGLGIDLAAGTIWLAAREGELPDWRQVIPLAAQQVVTLEAPALKKALERALILAEPNTHRVDLSPTGEHIVVSTKTDATGSTEPVPATGPEAPAFSINGEYLRAALAPIDGSVNLWLSGPLAPVRVEAPGTPGYTAVVVPLRV